VSAASASNAQWLKLEMTGVYKQQLIANSDTTSKSRRRNSLCNPPRRRSSGEVVEQQPRPECEKGEQKGLGCEKGPEQGQEQGQEQSQQHRLMLAAVEWSRVAWLPCHRPLVHPPARSVEEP
jgi:hypothetical protein